MSALFAAVEMAPRDPILGLNEQFNADPNPNKVNLGVGVYYDENGKLPLLKCVAAAEAQMAAKPVARGYLPIDGIPAYDKAVQTLVFGEAVAASGRVATVQGIGGTGGLKVGADFLKRLSPNAQVLISEQPRADFYEAAAKGRDAKLTANWVTNDLAARLTAGGIEIENSPIFPGAVAELVQLIEEGVISSKIAKDVFERMWNGEGSASEIVEKQGLRQVSDTGELEAIIDGLIAENPGQAAQVKEKPQAIGWFVGQVMKATGGKANPGVINQMLKAKLGA